MKTETETPSETIVNFMHEQEPGAQEDPALGCLVRQMFVAAPNHLVSDREWVHLLPSELI